jgi:hypothetical protein
MNSACVGLVIAISVLWGCTYSPQCKLGHAESVADATARYEEMVASGLDINSFGYDSWALPSSPSGPGLGETALQCLARKGKGYRGDGRPDVAAFLIEKGAKVDLPNGVGLTPLMSAALNYNFQVAQFLIEHGANLNAVDRVGHTPLDFWNFAAKQGLGSSGRNAAQIAAAIKTHGGVVGVEIPDTSIADLLSAIGAGVAAGARAGAKQPVVITVPVPTAPALAAPSPPPASQACPCTGANPVYYNGQCYPNSNAACGANPSCAWQLCK